MSAAAALARLLTARPPALTSDAALLGRFAAGDEAAFAEIVRRHGPMVRSVARRAARDPHLADDVSQAVFLVLVRKAGGLSQPDRLASWLFGVTRRTARRAAALRRRHVGRACPLADAPAEGPHPGWAEALRALDEELARLPEAERLPLVLCYLEGMTQDEAAGACGWSVRTLRRRLAAGRDRLRDRLVRRGFGPAEVLAALAVALSTEAGGPATTGPANGLVAELVRAELRPVGAKAVACLVVVAAAGLLVGLTAPGTPSPAAPSAPAAAAAPAPAPEQSDLPDGAVARLGSANLRHPGYLLHLRFTPDGRELISYGEGKLRRWDAHTGAPVRPVNPPRDIPTTYGPTLLTADGARVIAPHLDLDPDRFSVREYDLATGKHRELFVIPPRTGPDGKPDNIGVEKFTLSPDGTLLVEGHRHEAYLWELTTGTLRHHLKVPGEHNANYQFTPDGKYLVSASSYQDDAIRLWDVTTGKEAKTLTRNRRSGVGRLAISPDGRWLASVASFILNNETPLVLWDLTGRRPPRLLSIPGGLLDGALVFSPDGGMLYTVSEGWPGPWVARWDVEAGTITARWGGPRPNDHLSDIASAALSPDGTTLAVGHLSGVIRLFDAATGRELVPTAGHAARVVGVAFTPEGVRTVGQDGSVCLWDPITGRRRDRRDLAASARAGDEVIRVVASPDGRWVLTKAVSWTGAKPPAVAALWDAATGAPGWAWEIKGPEGPFDFGPDGRYLVGQVEGKGFRVWDTVRGLELPTIDRPLSAWKGRFTFLADGRTLVVCDEQSADGFDLATGRKRFSWKPADVGVLGRPGPGAAEGSALVWAVAASPDGKTLAVSVGGLGHVSKQNWALVLVEAETGRVVRRVGTPDTVAYWLAYSPDGRWIGSEFGVWDAATLKEVRRFPEKSRVTAVAFSPDGRRVATGHQDGTALVWRVGE